MVEGVGERGGGTSRRVECPPPPQVNSDCVHRDEIIMRNCFQYPLVVHSEISNDRALLSPFYHYIKMEAYMRVGVGDTLPRGRLSPHPQSPSPPRANIDYVHRDEIGENVSRTLLKGFRKLQITKLFSIPLWSWHKNERVQEDWEVGHTTLG